MEMRREKPFLRSELPAELQLHVSEGSAGVSLRFQMKLVAGWLGLVLGNKTHH